MPNLRRATIDRRHSIEGKLVQRKITQRKRKNRESFEVEHDSSSDDENESSQNEESENDEKEKQKQSDKSDKPRNKKMSPWQEDVLISAVLKRFEAIEKKSTDKSLTPKKLKQQQSDVWAEVQSEYQQKTKDERTIESLLTKWKNIKSFARRRDQLVRQSVMKTGGGLLTPAERRVIECGLYLDIAVKLGVSASGNPPRFDSDSVEPTQRDVSPPTKRLDRALSASQGNDENTRMSFGQISETQSECSSIEQHQNVTATPSCESATQSATISQLIQNNPALTSTSSIVEPPSSSSTTNSNKNEKTISVVPPKKGPRSVKDAQMKNYDQFYKNLAQQEKNISTQTELLNLSMGRVRMINEREMLQTQLMRIEVEKAEAMKNLEIYKQTQLAELEIEAKRRELGLPPK